MKRILNPWLQTEGYSCPGCCPTNDKGVKMEFFEDGDDIVSYWQPREEWQSWRDTLHGGVQCLLLDEIAGWVVFRKMQTIGVTSRMDTRYLHPVSIDGGPLEIRARIAKKMRNVLLIDAEIYQLGQLRTQAQATYFCAPREKAMAEYGLSACKTEDEQDMLEVHPENSNL